MILDICILYLNVAWKEVIKLDRKRMTPLYSWLLVLGCYVYDDGLEKENFKFPGKTV